MAITIAERPDTLSGCMAEWSESFAPNTIRTNMEAAGYVKVRRRTTGESRMIETSVTLQSNLYQDFVDWYFVRCQAGVLPTYIKRPQDGAEIVARFMDPPIIDFVDKNAFVATCKFETLPIWSKV